jgi:hypothetical protein
MSATRLLTIASALLFLTTSVNINASEDGITEPQPWPYCEETIDYYDLADPTPLGFSGADLIGLTNNISDVNINYNYKQGQSLGQVSITPQNNPVRYVHSVPVYPEGGVDLGIICGDRVELDVDFVLNSNDGAFADAWKTTLVSTNGAFCLDGEDCRAGEYSDFGFEISLASMNGNFLDDMSDPVPYLNFAGRVAQQKLTAHMGYSQCSCDDSSCTSYLFTAATLESVDL